VTQYTAVVLAGSRPGRDQFAEQYGTDMKALIPIGGEPMVRRPVRALLSSASVREVEVCSQSADRIEAAIDRDLRLSFRSSRTTIAETILEYCDDPQTHWPLLVTTADHALLDAATIEEFTASAAGADLAVGVVERDVMLRRFPDAQRTWLKFRGGAYTGANLFVLSSPAVRPAIELWRSVEQDRKKAWRVMSLLGPVTLLSVALRLVSLDEVMAQLGTRLGLSATAVKLTNPLAGVDVDKPADHELVEAILARKA